MANAATGSAATELDTEFTRGLGLFDSTMDKIFGDTVSGRGLVRQFFRAVAGGGLPPPSRLLFMAGAFAAVLIIMRALSMNEG